MYLRMIARDFSRNRTVTVVLIGLMVLSVTLVAASAGTLVRLVGASRDLMAQAAAPHVAQLHAGPFDPDRVARWAADRPEVVHHQAMLMLGIDGANLLFDNEPQTANIQQNSLVVPNRDRDLLLDLDNQPVTEVEPGTVLLPVIYEIEAGLEAGDAVTITSADGFAKELRIAGFVRDSIMNPAITSSKRLAVAPSDLEEVRAHTGEVEHLIEFWLHDPATETAAFERAYLDSDMPRAGQLVDSATFRTLTMVGDGLVAAVVVLVALLLLVVGLLCLRFSFLTAAEQDYRELGVLKAIGVAPGAIRRIYLSKYSLLAATTSLLGLVAGLVLAPLLSRNITRYMGAVSSSGTVVVPALAAVSVCMILIAFLIVLLRRFDRISAVTALRAGATTRQASRVPMRLHRSRMAVHVRLGAMDVANRLPTYVLLVFVFAVSTFVMIVPISSAATANSPDFITYMGIGDVDLRVDLRHDGPASARRFSAIVDEILVDPDVSAAAAMVTTRNATIDADGETTSLYVEHGDHTRLPVTYADGRAPEGGAEIALSLLALHEAGRAVGDTLPVVVEGQATDLAIVGSYQDITSGGKTAKAALPSGSDEVMWYAIGVELAPGVASAAKAEAYDTRFSSATIADIDQWRAQTLGPVADQMWLAAVVSAFVAVALAVLMTALFTRLLTARDAGQIAIQRAIGADDAGIGLQYLTRILIVLGIGVVVGDVAAMTLGETLFNLMFEGMFGGLEALGQGTSRIDFHVSRLLVHGALPIALTAVVALTTALNSRSIAHAHISTLATE